MFKTILVPLDGSMLAEQALLPACQIAQKFGAELLLLRVVSPDQLVPGLSQLAFRAENSADYALKRQMDEAEAYLVNYTLPMPGIPVRTRVLRGAAPEMIVATATEEPADLIVMSTHGRAGLTRLLYGSVAEAVLRGATTPVMLVPSRVFSRLRVEKAPVAMHSEAVLP
jgi:nucleotide-binding universal stress UspA family protein